MGNIGDFIRKDIDSGVNGDQDVDTAYDTGAAYVFSSLSNNVYLPRFNK